MWRDLSKQSRLRKFKYFSESHSCLPVFCSLRSQQDSIFVERSVPIDLKDYVNTQNQELGSFRDYSFRQIRKMRYHKFAISSGPFGFAWSSRDYGTAAEAIALTSEEDVDEIQELVEELNKEIQEKGQQKQPKMVGGMGVAKYNMLRRKQIKLETEAWEEAAKEYQELLVDMCEQKLAPNLPYVKSLFLGWFEPLRDAIAAEQELCKEGKNRKGYAPQFDLLPAGMMAVITMHKLMGLLMTGGGNGSARVVQAACHIGEAIEQEVAIL